MVNDIHHTNIHHVLDIDEEIPVVQESTYSWIKFNINSTLSNFLISLNNNFFFMFHIFMKCLQIQNQLFPVFQIRYCILIIQLKEYFFWYVDGTLRFYLRPYFFILKFLGIIFFRDSNVGSKLKFGTAWNTLTETWNSKFVTQTQFSLPDELKCWMVYKNWEIWVAHGGERIVES